jgi:hypothetical protein
MMVEPLTPLERMIIVTLIQRCYQQAGLPWHDNVMWTPSPEPAAVGAALRASRMPLNFMERVRRTRATEPTDRTWLTLDRRVRHRWPDGPDGPLAHVRWALDAALTRDGTPPERFHGIGRAGPWWPRADRVVVSEPPAEVHVERVDEDTHRLHNADGPAVWWTDGYAVYRYHGIAVPAEVIRSGWHGREIHRHPNSEVRRVGIERIGWTRYVAEAGWRLVASAPDPGNDPHELHLFEDPTRRDGVRVLVMTNGSPDRSGDLRRYAEAVPVHIDDPVEAAAWQYGCPVRVYRRLKRRT